MLGEFITAKKSSSWWTSIYMLQLAPGAPTSRIEKKVGIFVFRMDERAQRILHCDRVLAANSGLMYPPNSFCFRSPVRAVKSRRNAMEDQRELPERGERTEFPQVSASCKWRTFY